MDLKDAYLSIPIMTAQWNLLRFKWLDQTYEFRFLLFGLKQCSTSVHKSAEANASLDPTEGVQNHRMSRRHDADGSVILETDILIADTLADISVAGIQDKLGKVLPRTNTGDTRTDSELGDHEIGSSLRKHYQKMSTSTPTSVSISTSIYRSGTGIQ